MDKGTIQALTPLVIGVASIIGAVSISFAPDLEGKKELSTLMIGTGLAGAFGLARQAKD
jgi:hypothetical protein